MVGSVGRLGFERQRDGAVRKLRAHGHLIGIMAHMIHVADVLLRGDMRGIGRARYARRPREAAVVGANQPHARGTAQLLEAVIIDLGRDVREIHMNFARAQRQHLRLPVAAGVDALRRGPGFAAVHAARHDQPVVVDGLAVMIADAIGGDHQNIAVLQHGRVGGHVFEHVRLAVFHAHVVGGHERPGIGPGFQVVRKGDENAAAQLIVLEDEHIAAVPELLDAGIVRLLIERMRGSVQIGIRVFNRNKMHGGSSLYG